MSSVPWRVCLVAGVPSAALTAVSVTFGLMMMNSQSPIIPGGASLSAIRYLGATGWVALAAYLAVVFVLVGRRKAPANLRAELSTAHWAMSICAGLVGFFAVGPLFVYVAQFAALHLRPVGTCKVVYCSTLSTALALPEWAARQFGLPPRAKLPLGQEVA